MELRKPISVFLRDLNADAALNLNDGAKYADSTDISDEVSDQKLRNGDESIDDRVTGFFDIHNGTDEREIDDLADLNVQIGDSIITRDIDVTDATHQTVDSNRS